MLLTTRQAADRLGLSTRTVLRMVQRGELAGVRLLPGPARPGNHLRFEPAEIARWIEEHGTEHERAAS